MNDRPLYTIRRFANGYVLKGCALPSGRWFTKCHLATQFARKQLAFGEGARVELYGPKDILFFTFIVAGSSSPVPESVTETCPAFGDRAAGEIESISR